MAIRPDVGISPSEVTVDGYRMTVNVHSLGSVASPSGRVVVETSQGAPLASATFEALEAPNDLRPKVQPVTLTLPSWVPTGSRIRLVLDGEPLEISRQNNVVPHAP
jgi:hypothetical protein